MLQRYEFDNRTSGGVLEFASFDEGQAHHRKRSVYKFTYNVRSRDWHNNRHPNHLPALPTIH